MTLKQILGLTKNNSYVCEEGRMLWRWESFLRNFILERRYESPEKVIIFSRQILQRGFLYLKQRTSTIKELHDLFCCYPFIFAIHRNCQSSPVSAVEDASNTRQRIGNLHMKSEAERGLCLNATFLHEYSVHAKISIINLGDPEKP